MEDNTVRFDDSILVDVPFESHLAQAAEETDSESDSDGPTSVVVDIG